MDTAYTFMLGISTAACLAIGLFFLRFWRRTGDRLFLAFGAAFWLMAANAMANALVSPHDSYPAVYLLRLLAFICIIAGILDKNRHAGRSAPSRSSAPPPPT